MLLCFLRVCPATRQYLIAAADCLHACEQPAIHGAGSCRAALVYPCQPMLTHSLLHLWTALHYVISNAAYTGAAIAAQIVNLVGSDVYLAQDFPVSVVLSTGDASLADDDVNTSGGSTTMNNEPGSPLISGTHM